MNLLLRSAALACCVVATTQSLSAQSPAAQSSTVVPSGFSTLDAPGQLGLPGLGLTARLQIILDPSTLTALVGHDLTAVSFRVDALSTAELAPAAGDLSLHLGSALVDSREPSPNFSQNLVAPTEVFSSDIRAEPSAFTIDPFGLRIEFKRPYAYAGGGLVLDLQGTAGPDSSYWAFDAIVESSSDDGVVQPVGSACGSYGLLTATVGERDLRPGGSPRFVCLGEPGAVGTLLVGSDLLPTPLDLDVLGFVGCTLRIQSFASVSTSVASIFGDPSLPGAAQIEPTIPAVPGLHGSGLVAQWVNFGTRLEVSNALSLSLASQDPATEVATVRGPVDAMSGAVSPGLAPVLRFEWQ